MINSTVFIQELERKLIQYNYNNRNCGIVKGDAGMILALAGLYSYFKNECFLDKMYEILDAVLDRDEYNLSFGYGISGFAWCISLINEDLIENRNEWLTDIQQKLEIEYRILLEQGNLDYFKGATGIMFYFLNSPIQIDSMNEIIDSYVDVVQTKALKNNWFITDSIGSFHTDRVFNLGTPHGLTGIILILLIIKEQGYDVDEKLLHSLFRIITSYEFKYKRNENKDCYFPSKVFEDGRRAVSGLAWCYGDLMIAYAMLKYGVMYKNDYYAQYAQIILKKTLSREIKHSEKLILCHGYPSLSLIYNAIYEKTGDVIYDDASKRYEHKFERAILGDYLEYKKNAAHSYFFEEPSLLIGYSGAILLLLFFEGHNEFDLSKCLLL